MKIDLNSGPGALLDGSWGGLGAMLAPRPFQTLKSSKYYHNSYTPRGQVGTQNRRKVDPGALRKAIDFLMGCWTGFSSNIVATWLEIRRKIRSKIGQFWTQHRFRLEHGFDRIFGTIFYGFPLLAEENTKGPRARMYCKYQYKINFFNYGV